jgi:hypothetical protein
MRNWSDRADSLTSQFQDMSTTDVVGLLGDQDKELDAEFMAIQERLQEIHDRKRTVDRLNRDMQALQPRGTLLLFCYIFNEFMIIIRKSRFE